VKAHEIGAVFAPRPVGGAKFNSMAEKTVAPVFHCGFAFARWKLCDLAAGRVCFSVNAMVPVAECTKTVEKQCA
jgi:hypothetical protein